MITHKHLEKISIIDELKKSGLQKLIQEKRKTNPVVGLVRMFKDGEVLKDPDNLNEGWITNMTVASGREFAAQSMFKKFHASSSLGDVSTYKVDSFAVGKNGSTVDVNNIVTLHGPNLGDIGLDSPIELNSNCISAKNNSGVVVPNIVKRITSTGPGGLVGTIEMETSNDPDFVALPTDFFTVVKCSCYIDNGEPTYLNANETVKIDEAMLYLTSSTNTNPIPFAKINFAPKFIELESVFKIEWYVIY